MLRTILFATIAFLYSTLSIAAQSGWKFELDEREHPGLQYVANDKSVFTVGCGHAFGIHAVYPGPRRKVGAKATVTLSNTKQQMTLRGEIEETSEDDQAGSTQFVQWDLGYRRQDPALFGPGWKKLEDRLFDLLDSGKPLTLSAEGKRYVLPPVDSPQWKARFKEKC